MKKPFIFILDENLELAGVLEDYLNHLGYNRVYLGTNSSVLEELFKRHPFEIVFLDYSSLAGFAGKYRPIRQMKTRPSLIVLIHSTYDQGVEAAMHKLGIKCFLKKPYELEAVRALTILARNSKRPSPKRAGDKQPITAKSALG